MQWDKAASFWAFIALPWFCLALFALWYGVAQMREQAIDRWGTRGVLPARRAARDW